MAGLIGQCSNLVRWPTVILYLVSYCNYVMNYLRGGGGYFSIFKADRLFVDIRTNMKMTIITINTTNIASGIPIINPLFSPLSLDAVAKQPHNKLIHTIGYIQLVTMSYSIFDSLIL